jgi:hypothetical protein
MGNWTPSIVPTTIRPCTSWLMISADTVVLGARPMLKRAIWRQSSSACWKASTAAPSGSLASTLARFGYRSPELAARAMHSLWRTRFRERMMEERVLLQQAVQATWAIYAAMHPEADNADERQCSLSRHLESRLRSGENDVEELVCVFGPSSS